MLDRELLFMQLSKIGLIMIFTGFLLLFLTIGLSASFIQSTNFQYGGLILIGPLPIFFGNYPSSDISSIILFGIFLTIIAIIMYIVSLIILRRTNRPW
jgi:uncharacterized membrane protein